MWINRIVAASTLLLLSATATATEYYISASGGSGSGSRDDPWSLSYANTQLRAGDKAILRGGTYTTDKINPSQSGTSESRRIIYEAFPGETPKFRPGSRTDAPIILANRSYITIDGIDADGGGIYRDSKYDHWIKYDNTTHTVLKNSKLVRSEGYSAFEFKNGSNYNKILNNVIEYNGTWNTKPWKGNYDDSGSAMRIYPGNNHNLIQGNIITKSGHDLVSVKGDYNVIRQNYFSNFWEVYDGPSFTFKVADISTGDKVGNRTLSVKIGKRNVIEDNVFDKVPESVDNSGVGIMKVGGSHQIVRRNFFINSTGQGEGIGSSVGSSSPLIQYNKIYNNTFYNMGGPAWWVNSYSSDYPAPKGNVFKNNIVYKTRQRPQYGDESAEFSFSKGLLKYYGSAFLDNQISNNCVAYDSTASEQVVYTGEGGTQSLTYYETNYPDIFFDNIQQAPDFVSSSPVNRQDFSLSASSPCINQAGDLAKTKSTATGTIVPVSDASFFTDGNGVIEGDQINIGNEKVQVIGVNISTNELTIDRSISWVSGMSVNLAVLDNKPDIGAVEFGSSSSSHPLPPQQLNIFVNQ